MCSFQPAGSLVVVVALEPRAVARMSLWLTLVRGVTQAASVPSSQGYATLEL